MECFVSFLEFLKVINAGEHRERISRWIIAFNELVIT